MALSLAVCVQVHFIIFAMASTTSSIVEIQQTLALFAILTDTHRYNELGKVFTEDAFADLGTPGTTNLTGLPEILTVLRSLSNITGQHSYGTQYVNLASPETANATTYFTGTFFGQGDLQGQILQKFARYETEMQFTEQGWRVKKLAEISTGHTGNLSIVFPTS